MTSTASWSSTTRTARSSSRPRPSSGRSSPPNTYIHQSRCRSVAVPARNADKKPSWVAGSVSVSLTRLALLPLPCSGVPGGGTFTRSGQEDRPRVDLTSSAPRECGERALNASNRSCAAGRPRRSAIAAAPSLVAIPARSNRTPRCQRLRALGSSSACVARPSPSTSAEVETGGECWDAAARRDAGEFAGPGANRDVELAIAAAPRFGCYPCGL